MISPLKIPHKLLKDSPQSSTPTPVTISTPYVSQIQLSSAQKSQKSPKTTPKKFFLPPNETFVVKNQYKILEKLGSGSFGEIYQAIDKVNKTRVAVKIEAAITKPQLLMSEAYIYKVMGQASGLPQIFWCGNEINYNFLVMELLGPSLEALFNSCGRKFSLKTTLLIADQIFALIEMVHSKNFIHRDIKPDNFLIGQGQNREKIYIVDFGLSKRYRELVKHPNQTRKNQSPGSFNAHSTHIPMQTGRALAGTARYSSINAHNGIQQSRRDDLESCNYVLNYFITGKLPWQGLKALNKQHKYDQIARCKTNTSISQLCTGLPIEFNLSLSYTRNLRFDETPDYAYLRQLFRILYRTFDYKNDYIYDWNEKKTTKNEMNNNVQNENNLKTKQIDKHNPNYLNNLQF